MENFLNHPIVQTEITVTIRLLCAVLLSFAIGLEREMTNKYAGLRTNILVCVGACVFTLLSIYGFPTFALGDNVSVDNATGIRDTARVAAQVVTGIGFIGGVPYSDTGQQYSGLLRQQPSGWRLLLVWPAELECTA